MSAPPAPASVTDRLSGHVVVCGVDHLGHRTIGELRLRGESVVSIAPGPPAEDDAELTQVPVVVGDPRREAVLRRAGVDRAAAIVLATDDDAGNLDAALAAQELNPSIRVVIRMFDAELGAHLQTLFPDAIVLSSSAIAAPAFVSAALDGEGGERFLVAGRLLSTRLAGDDPAAFEGSAPLAPPIARFPIAHLRGDRTVEILPDASPDAPGVITIDGRESVGSLRGARDCGWAPDPDRRSGGAQDSASVRHPSGPGHAALEPGRQPRSRFQPRCRQHRQHHGVDVARGPRRHRDPADDRVRDPASQRHRPSGPRHAAGAGRAHGNARGRCCR